MNLRSYRLLLDPTGTEGNGTPAPAPTPSPAPTPTPAPAADPTEGWKQLLAKHNNDAADVAKKLFDENHSLREKNRELRARVPAAEAVVLSGDDAKAWSEYRTLGDVEALKQIKEDYPRVKADLGDIRKAEFHKQIADAHIYKVAVLSRLIDQEQLDIAVEKDAKTGKPVAFVKDEADGKGRKTPLPDYLKGHPVLADFLPALSIQPDRTPPGTPPRADSAGPPPTDTTSRAPLPLLTRGF